MSGGTVDFISVLPVIGGLSPHERGNLVLGIAGLVCEGSIPA